MIMILWLIAGCAIVVLKPPPVAVERLRASDVDTSIAPGVPAISLVLETIAAQENGSWSCG
jgi:hypothetical protein